MAFDLSNVINVLVEGATNLVEKSTEKVKEFSESASQVKNMNRNANKSLQENKSTETIYYKAGFQNLIYLYNILNEKKNELAMWEKMDKVLSKVNVSFSEDESTDSSEVICNLTSTDVCTFANNLLNVGTQIYLQEEDGSWTELEEFFKLTSDDFEMYNQQGYFSRQVKMVFKEEKIRDVEAIVDENKARIVNDVVIAIKKICKLPHDKDTKKITSSLLAAMQSLLNTIRADFNNHLNLSMVYDIISDAYENFWKELPSEEKEILDCKDKQVIEVYCAPEDVVIDINTIPKSVYTNKIIPRLGLYTIDISKGNDQAGRYFVKMSLPGAKVSRLRKDIQNARTNLKKETLNQIETLLNLIPKA